MDLAIGSATDTGDGASRLHHSFQNPPFDGFELRLLLFQFSTEHHRPFLPVDFISPRLLFGLIAKLAGIILNRGEEVCRATSFVPGVRVRVFRSAVFAIDKDLWRRSCKPNRPASVLRYLQGKFTWFPHGCLDRSRSEWRTWRRVICKRLTCRRLSMSNAIANWSRGPLIWMWSLAGRARRLRC